ncbi:beta-lactamase-like protein [Lipomyces orientalis]|uniref:Beta-lactamase-like protein n=1 Tax=Lipomyces orientalis TaxID=1233043 RepID=A0ACC3TL08_9ASCO
MTNKLMHILLSVAALSLGTLASICNPTQDQPLRVETFVNTDQGVNMVSSLIIGSQASMVIDLPMTIGKSKELASWVKATTDKPVVAVFTSHNHPDHYLGNSAFFEEFPDARYYAKARVARGIQSEAAKKVEDWSRTFGSHNVVQNTSIPSTYDYSFFALPGDENAPVYLFDPMSADTIDVTIFWIPSLRILVPGDAIFGHDLHIWLSDLVTPALTESWLTSLQFMAGLEPSAIIPGHASSNSCFDGTQDLEHTYEYIRFFQGEIESKGPNYFTPTEIYERFDNAFPGMVNTGSSTGLNRLNITAEHFGRGGKSRVHYQPLSSYNDSAVLNGWIL